VGAGREFRLGYIRGPGIMALVLDVAQENDFFKTEGVRVRLVRCTMEELDEGLASGSLDMVRRGPDADMVNSLARGGTIKVVAAVANRPVGELVTHPNYRSLTDLRGKSLAVIHPRLGSTAFLRHLLWQSGVNSRDYTLDTAGGTPQRYVALTSGRVAGAMLSPPEAWQAKQDGFRVLASLPICYPAAISTSFQVDCATAERRRGVVVGFLRALVRAHRWVYSPENNQAVLAGLQRLGYTRQQAHKDYAFFIGSRVLASDCAVSKAAMEQMVDLLTDIGELRRPAPNPGYFVDSSFLEDAVAELPAKCVTV